MSSVVVVLSVCVDDDMQRVENLIDALQVDYKVTYNQNLQLLTVRHYNEEILEELIGSKKVFLEQKSRSTARFVCQ